MKQQKLTITVKPPKKGYKPSVVLQSPGGEPSTYYRDSATNWHTAMGWPAAPHYTKVAEDLYQKMIGGGRANCACPPKGHRAKKGRGWYTSSHGVNQFGRQMWSVLYNGQVVADISRRGEGKLQITMVQGPNAGGSDTASSLAEAKRIVKVYYPTGNLNQRSKGQRTSRDRRKKVVARKHGSSGWVGRVLLATPHTVRGRQYDEAHILLRHDGYVAVTLNTSPNLYRAQGYAPPVTAHVKRPGGSAPSAKTTAETRLRTVAKNLPARGWDEFGYVGY